MAEAAEAAPPKTQPDAGRSVGALLRATEIDFRLLGMVGALAAILIGFGLLTNGKILAPASLVSLSIQFAVVAIMATGMVLIIVSRNIDLSVGSTQGLIAMLYAMLMTSWLPALGINEGNPVMWIVALAIGLVFGVAVGAFQGFIIAYVGVPSFIVTLGGLLAFRGTVWVLSSGAAVSGIDPTFLLLRGDYLGSIGDTVSWVLAFVCCVGVLALLALGGRRLEGGADLGGLLGDVVVVAAPTRDAKDHQQDRSHDIVLVALPQLLQLLAAYFLVNFLENVVFWHVDLTRRRSWRPRAIA